MRGRAPGRRDQEPLAQRLAHLVDELRRRLHAPEQLAHPREHLAIEGGDRGPVPDAAAVGEPQVAGVQRVRLAAAFEVAPGVRDEAGVVELELGPGGASAIDHVLEGVVHDGF